MSNLNNITFSEFIEHFASTQSILPQQAEQTAKVIINTLAQAFQKGQRAEIRGFGSFEVRKTEARQARNPKTGKTVTAPAKRSVHFRPGKALRQKVDYSKQ